MLIFEIITPGTWLADEDRDWSSKIETLLGCLESKFFEANLALNLFTAEQEKPPARPVKVSLESWALENRRRYQIRQ